MMQQFCLLKTPHFGFTVKRPQIALQRAPSTLKLDGKCCKLSQKNPFPRPLSQWRCHSLRLRWLKHQLKKALTVLHDMKGGGDLERSETTFDDMFTIAALWLGETRCVSGLAESEEQVGRSWLWPDLVAVCGGNVQDVNINTCITVIDSHMWDLIW